MPVSLLSDKKSVLQSVHLFFPVQWPAPEEMFDFWIKLSLDIAKALVVAIGPYLYLGSGTWKIQLLNIAILLGAVFFFHQLALNLIQSKKRAYPPQSESEQNYG